jgi:hypothetical protein
MKVKALLLALVFGLFFCFGASAPCNATFSVTDLGGGTCQFQANYTPQSGYTYSDGWSLGIYGFYSGQSSFVQNFQLGGTYTFCHELVVQDSLGATICISTQPLHTCCSFSAQPATQTKKYSL